MSRSVRILNVIVLDDLSIYKWVPYFGTIMYYYLNYKIIILLQFHLTFALRYAILTLVDQSTQNPIEILPYIIALQKRLLSLRIIDPLGNHWYHKDTVDINRYKTLTFLGSSRSLPQWSAIAFHEWNPPDEKYTGIEICHKCDVKGCWNPEHIYVGTHGTNRSDVWRNAKPTYCMNGHLKNHPAGSCRKCNLIVKYQMYPYLELFKPDEREFLKEYLKSLN